MRHWFAYHPRIFTLAVVLLGLGATAAAGWMAHRHEREALEADFATRQAIRQSALRESLASYEDTVRALAMLFSASGEVSRSEFALATQSLLQRRPGIQALQWVPMVPGRERFALENRASAETGRPFVTTVRDNTGQLSVSPLRDEHWPILYSQPVAGNERALGFDLSQGPTRATLERARQSGRLQVTPRISLVQTAGDDPGIVAVAPVFRNGEFVGWVQGVFRVRIMLRAASLSPGLRAHDLMFLDRTLPDDHPSYLLHTEMADGETSLNLEPGDFTTAWHSRFDLHFGDRIWEVLARPASEWVRQRQSPLVFLILGAGVLVTALAGVMVDVLARRAEWGRRLVSERTVELAENRRRLQEILDFSPVAIFVKDLDRRYVEVNPHFCKLLGHPREQIIGRTDDDLFRPEDAAQFFEGDSRALTSGSVIQHEARAHCNGHERWSIVHKFPLTDGKGQVVGLCGIVTDISNLKEAEHGRLHAERRLQVRQRLDGLAVLAGGIAHDLNNVLAPILLTVDVLRSSAEDDTTRDLLDSLGQSARRGAGLVRQVLAFARGVEGNRESVDLVAMVRALVKQAGEIGTPGLQVSASLPDHPTTVRADADQLHRALLNLVVNARDAMPHGGHLQLSVDSMEVDALFAANLPELSPGHYRTIAVSDTGSGIPVEVRDRIFEPFFTTKPPGRGTGLGLAMVDAIVRAHHGAVTVYSEPNRETTFRLYLPAHEDGTKQAVHEDKIARRGEGRTILVVDDEPAIRAATRRTLESAGYQVLLASQGLEALEVFANHEGRIDLVLTDLVMEGMDGAELLENLTARFPDLPVLVTSGFPATDRVAKALAERRWRFLPKPATASQLLQALSETLANGDAGTAGKSD